MSATQLTPPPTAEEQQISDITARLERRYPREQITLAELEALVRHTYASFDGATVRSYVAVLAERAARHSIEHPPHFPPDGPERLSRLPIQRTGN